MGTCASGPNSRDAPSSMTPINCQKTAIRPLTNGKHNKQNGDRRILLRTMTFRMLGLQWQPSGVGFLPYVYHPPSGRQQLWRGLVIHVVYFPRMPCAVIPGYPPPPCAGRSMPPIRQPHQGFFTLALPGYRCDPKPARLLESRWLAAPIWLGSTPVRKPWISTPYDGMKRRMQPLPYRWA